MKFTSAAVMMNDGKLAPCPPKNPYALAPEKNTVPARDALFAYPPAALAVKPLGIPANWSVVPGSGCAYTGSRGSFIATIGFTSVCESLLSSRVWKNTDHGLLYTPSPGQCSTALSAFVVIRPPGAVNAARSSVLAVPGSTFTSNRARRARSEFANFCQDCGSPS